MRGRTHACVCAHACVRGVTAGRDPVVRAARPSGPGQQRRLESRHRRARRLPALLEHAVRGRAPRRQAPQRWPQSPCGCGTRMGSPRPRLHRDCAHRCDLCVGGRASRSTQGAIQGYSRGNSGVLKGYSKDTPGVRRPDSASSRATTCATRRRRRRPSRRCSTTAASRTSPRR